MRVVALLAIVAGLLVGVVSATASPPSAGGPVDVGGSDPGGLIEGGVPYAAAGTSVAGIGDMNGDGLADVVVGMGVGSTSSDFARAYVVFGVRVAARLAPGGRYGAVKQSTVNVARIGGNGFEIKGDPTMADPDLTGALDARGVAGAGDVNGDGIPDVIIGTSAGDANGRVDSGSAFVVFGSRHPATADLNALGSRGFRIDGAVAGEEAGMSVAGVGDLNGDGRQDVAISTGDNPGDNGVYPGGSVYVVYGSARPVNVDLANLGASGIRIHSPDAISSVAGAGDLNGDGKNDLIIGSDSHDGISNGPGAAFVVFGSATLAGLDLSNLGASGYTIVGANSTGRAGFSVAGAGDVNGDGRDDVIVGAPDNLPTRPGNAYVVFGSTSSDTVKLASLGGRGFHIHGVNGNFGASVAGAGDVNGDGRDDLIIGAPSDDPGGIPLVGSAFVVFGSRHPADLSVRHLVGRGFQIEGTYLRFGDPTKPEANHAGASVSGAGDFSGDGRDDVIVGAPDTKAGNVYLSGAAWLIYDLKPPLAKPKTTTLHVHIVGSPRAGQTLRCTHATVPRVSRYYIGWLRDSPQDEKPVAAASFLRHAGATYPVTTADVGHVLSCVVTAQSASGDTTSRAAPVRVS